MDVRADITSEGDITMRDTTGDLKTIETKIEELPKDLKKEVLDYIEFLLQKYSKKKEKDKFRFDWEGCLSKLRDKFTSVELQHKATEWR